MFKRLFTALMALAATASASPHPLQKSQKDQMSRASWPAGQAKALLFGLLCLSSTASFAQSSVSLTITPNLYVGDTATLTATVSGNAPTGTVTFYTVAYYGQPPAVLDTAPVNAGIATLSKVFGTAGYQSVTAVYSGDADNAGATSPAVSLNVQQKPTLTTLTLGSSSLQAGQALSVTATVTGDHPSGSVNVSFYIGNKWYSVTAPLTKGQAILTAPSYATATIGTQSAQAFYMADAINAVSMSRDVPYKVGAPAGNAPPTVSIATPANNVSVAGPAHLAVTAAAQDADGTIAKVEYFQGSTLLATVTEAPYAYTWNVDWGTASLMAVATDDKGATAASAPVTVTVTPNATPTVSLSSPANNASFTAPANITLTTQAADSDGSIAKVDFYNGTTLLGSVTQAPYQFQWSNVGAGSYSITAKATDNLGTSTTSAPVTVTVKAASASAQAYYIHVDQLDTPREITDATGNAVWQWNEEEAFGGNAPNQDPNGTGQNFVFNLRFPGQYFDKETNLHYNLNRDYDPATGRYIESDPIGLYGGIGTYTYVANAPLDATDPLGLFPGEDEDHPTYRCTIGDGCHEEHHHSGMEGASDDVNNAVHDQEARERAAATAVAGSCIPKSGVPGPNFNVNPNVKEPYARPSGAGPTAAQRSAVQGKPCVDCGAVTSKQVADHVDPLVVQYYRDGAVDVEKQSSVDAVQPHCPSCSAVQGGQLGAFGRRMRALLGF